MSKAYAKLYCPEKGLYGQMAEQKRWNTKSVLGKNAERLAGAQWSVVMVYAAEGIARCKLGPLAWLRIGDGRGVLDWPVHLATVRDLW